MLIIKQPRLWLFGLYLFLQITLFAQPKLLLSNIVIEGNKRTHKEVFTREMTIQVGDTLSLRDTAAIWQRNHQNIYNLRLFNTVKLLPIISAADSNAAIIPITLHIEVKERWYFFPIPSIIIEERNSYDLLQAVLENTNRPIRQWKIPRLSYNLALVWKNLSGHNDTWYFWGQTGFANRLQTEYVRPWLLPRQKIDFFVGLQYREQKQLIYGTENGVVQWGRTTQSPLQTTYKAYMGVRKRFNPFKSLYTQISYAYTVLNDSIYQFRPEYLSNSNSVEHYPSWNWVYTNDKRDIKTFPLAGFRYRFMARFAGYLPGSTTSFSKLGYTFAHYLPLSKRFYFSYSSQAMFTFGKRVPFFEKTAVWIDKDEFPDYYNDLRGYERYGIDGTTVALAKTEIKYAIFPRRIVHLHFIPFKKFQDFPLGIYLSGFVEGGYVADNSFNNQDKHLKNKLLYGYGTSLQFITIYDHIIRLELARNHFGQIGFNFHAVLPIM